MTDPADPFLQMVGRRVRTARQAAGVSQAELADFICLSRPTIANLEAGRQDMPVSRLALVAWGLGVDVADLVKAEPVTRRQPLPARRLTAMVVETIVADARSARQAVR